MLIGYVLVSKSDGSQTLDLQQDALIKSGIQSEYIYKDMAFGRKDARPRKMDKPTLKMAMAAMSDPKSVASEVAKRLGITTTTLYMYINGDGSLKEAGSILLINNKSKGNING